MQRALDKAAGGQPLQWAQVDPAPLRLGPAPSCLQSSEDTSPPWASVSFPEQQVIITPTRGAVSGWRDQPHLAVGTSRTPVCPAGRISLPRGSPEPRLRPWVGLWGPSCCPRSSLGLAYPERPRYPPVSGSRFPHQDTHPHQSLCPVPRLGHLWRLSHPRPGGCLRNAAQHSARLGCRHTAGAAYGPCYREGH